MFEANLSRFLILIFSLKYFWNEFESHEEDLDIAFSSQNGWNHLQIYLHLMQKKENSTVVMPNDLRFYEATQNLSENSYFYLLMITLGLSLVSGPYRIEK